MFITVPYGKKKIYKNLQQFGKADLSRISRIFKNFKKSFIFYKFIDKTWILSSEKECRNIGPIVKKSDNRFVLSAKSIVLIKFYN